MRKLLKNRLATLNSSWNNFATATPRLLARNPPPRILRRHSVALGAGIGALASVIPLPIQIPIAVLAAIWLRAHVATAAAATLVSNPLTIVPIWAAAWKIGSAIAGSPDTPPDLQFDWSFQAGWSTLVSLLNVVSAHGQPLLVGLPVLGAALGLAAYIVVMLAWRFTVAAWRQR